LSTATDHFNASGYEKFVVEFHQSKFYDLVDGEHAFIVQRIGSTAMARTVLKNDLRCDCSTFVASDFVHCRHILRIFQNVDFSKVTRRWRLRKSVQSVTTEFQNLMYAHMSSSIPGTNGKYSCVPLTPLIHTDLSHRILLE